MGREVRVEAESWRGAGTIRRGQREEGKMVEMIPARWSSTSGIHFVLTYYGHDPYSLLTIQNGIAVREESGKQERTIFVPVFFVSNYPVIGQSGVT